MVCPPVFPALRIGGKRTEKHKFKINPLPHSKVKATLGYISPCFRINNETGKEAEVLFAGQVLHSDELSETLVPK